MEAEFTVPLLLLVALVFYIVAVLLVFLILRFYFPQLFISKAGLSSAQVEAQAQEESLYSMADLSCLSACIPCTDCSLRAALRRCCPTGGTTRLRQAMTVDWLRRPNVDGQSGINLVCCSVA